MAPLLRRGFARALGFGCATALSACCEPPPNGALPDGRWGGAPDPISLDVAADGTGTLQLACVAGTSAGPIDVVDGVVAATLSFDPDDWGVDDEVDHPPFDVLLEGTVCGSRFDAHTTSSEPDQLGDQDFVLVLGRERGLEVPCAQ